MDRLTVCTLLVATAAAVRSTWSPCGWSVLSTITPVAERRRGHRFGWTAGCYVAGAVVGGLCLGAGTALVGTALPLRGPAALLAGAGACLVASVGDAAWGPSLPRHRRQVNEDWLEAYRPGVYGAGFGWQIGTGVLTYVTTSAVHLLVVLGALGGARTALSGGLVFGLVRGLAVLLTTRCTTPQSLVAFHRAFAQAEPWGRRLVATVTMGGAALLLVGPWGLVIVALGQISWCVTRERRATQPGIAGM